MRVATPNGKLDIEQSMNTLNEIIERMDAKDCSEQTTEQSVRE